MRDGVKRYGGMPHVDTKAHRNGGWLGAGGTGGALTRVAPSQAGPPRFVTPPIGAHTITLEEYRRWELERFGDGTAA